MVPKAMHALESVLVELLLVGIVRRRDALLVARARESPKHVRAGLPLQGTNIHHKR